MKKTSKLPKIYLAAVIILMYLPIIFVMIYSFNESKISSIWAGVSLKWYEDLFRDRAIMQALVNSVILGAI